MNKSEHELAFKVEELLLVALARRRGSAKFFGKAVPQGSPFKGRHMATATSGAQPVSSSIV